MAHEDTVSYYSDIRAALESAFNFQMPSSLHEAESSDRQVHKMMNAFRQQTLVSLLAFTSCGYGFSAGGAWPTAWVIGSLGICAVHI